MPIKVEVVQWDKAHTEHIPHPGLRAHLEGRVGNLEEYIRSIIAHTCLAIGEAESEADDFYVKIITTKNPEFALAFKYGRRCWRRVPPVWDMFLGYAGDLTEFKRSIIHETLHVMRWDEKAVREKTEDILNALLSR